MELGWIMSDAIMTGKDVVEQIKQRWVGGDLEKVLDSVMEKNKTSHVRGYSRH